MTLFDPSSPSSFAQSYGAAHLNNDGRAYVVTGLLGVFMNIIFFILS